MRVLYDQQCSVCCRLAEYGRRQAKEGISFSPWQDFVLSEEAKGFLSEKERRQDPRSLCVITSNRQFLEGPAAWEALLKEHPSLHAVNWMAQRLGLLQQTAKLLNHGGHFVRRLCRSCGRR